MEEIDRFALAADLLSLMEPDEMDDDFDDDDFDDGMFPNCFSCTKPIEHEGLLAALFVINEQNTGSHRFNIVITCPPCGRQVAAADPLRRKEFAYDPNH